MKNLLKTLMLAIFITEMIASCGFKSSKISGSTSSSIATQGIITSPIKLPRDISDIILFVSVSRQSGASSIYGVSTNGAVMFHILEILSPYRIVGHLDWSADKRMIAFSLANGARSDIFIMDLMNSALYSVTSGTRFGGVEPRWAPNGTRLAYVCGEYEPDICMIGSDGTNYTQLTSHPSRDIAPSWSPDGSAIAYQTSRGGLSDIYVLNLTKMTERDMTGGISQNAQPSWSPDGKYILFQSDRDGSMDIFVVPVEGGQAMNLTNNKALDVDPQWSPNGELIAFRSNRSGEWDLFIMRRDGSGLINLTAGWGPVFTYAWSPDGRYLAFASSHTGNSDIYMVSIKNREIVRLTNQDTEDMAPIWISLK